MYRSYISPFLVVSALKAAFGGHRDSLLRPFGFHLASIGTKSGHISAPKSDFLHHLRATMVLHQFCMENRAPREKSAAGGGRSGVLVKQHFGRIIAIFPGVF